jgi:hypothetical protein
MKTKIAKVPIWTRLDNKSNTQGRRSPIRKVTHKIDTPLPHPHCRTDNRRCQPHQTHPLGYSLMTKKVVIMSKGYITYATRNTVLIFITLGKDHEKIRHLRMGIDCIISYQWNVTISNWRIQTVHQLRHEPADEVQQTWLMRMQSPNCFNKLRPKSSPQTNPKVPTKW